MGLLLQEQKMTLKVIYCASLYIILGQKLDLVNLGGSFLSTGDLKL